MGKKKKNKIRKLDSDTDFTEIFIGKPSDKKTNPQIARRTVPKNTRGTDISDEKFAELIDMSLKGKNMDRMLREKSERGAPAKVPLSKRLKKYPPPESKLDLHGFTGDGAAFKADSYLRTAFAKGLFTVKVIVGKGTHSEFGAVLPGVVQDLLKKLKDEGIVLHHVWEKKRQSKSGAIIVYLNQFND